MLWEQHLLLGQAFPKGSACSDQNDAGPGQPFHCMYGTVPRATSGLPSPAALGGHPSDRPASHPKIPESTRPTFCPRNVTKSNTQSTWGKVAFVAECLGRARVKVKKGFALSPHQCNEGSTRHHIRGGRSRAGALCAHATRTPLTPHRVNMVLSLPSCKSHHLLP